MTRKHFCCGLLIVALTVGIAKPARASDQAVTVLIVVAATALAATIAAVTVSIVHHQRKKIVISGCAVSGETGMKLTDEEDKKTYILSGETTGIKVGDRMKLEGKRQKVKGPSRVWETTRVIEDFGVCQP